VKLRFIILAAASLLTAADLVPAQPASTSSGQATSTSSGHAYPARPVRLVVPSSPGGGTDASSRILAPRLSELLGQQVVVENRPGASTMIGLEVVAKSPHDGYTLVMANSTMAILPSMKKNLRMDVIRGLAPITLVASNPQILVSHPALPASNLKQLIALAKARPGKLDYASGGYGGNPHMCMELFLSMAGLKITYVPYKSGNAGIMDVIAGQVPVMMAGVLSAMPHVRTGRLRAYGVTTAQRFSSVPDIPTIAEAGVPGYEATQWFGVLAPAGTPRDIIARLHADTVRALKDPEVRKRFVADGSDTVTSASPEEFAAYIRADEAKWAKVVKGAGLKPE
jgi:tripartite-type tricarboxylate transporter receptor subunit TctC